MRGEVEGTDRGDEGGDCGNAAVESGGDIASSGVGKESEENEKVKKEQVKTEEKIEYKIIQNIRNFFFVYIVK